MCITHLFHTTKPCCGDSTICKAFPSIDWAKATWKVKQPAALWAEQLYAPSAYAGPLVFFGTGDPDNGKFSYSGTFPEYTSEPRPGDSVIRDVLFSWHGFHIRAGEFVSSYAGDCSWKTQSRERLCPNFYSLMLIDKGFFWAVSAKQFTHVTETWEAIRLQASYDADVITGPFFMQSSSEYGYAETGIYYSWRDVLRSAECQFIPSIAARGLPMLEDFGVESGLLYRIEAARTRLNDGLQASSNFYRPTAMDLAVEWTLSGGIDFGVVASRQSPFFGQFKIFTGGQYGQDEVFGPWLSTSPWRLVDRPAVVAEFGVVNRFERTDDNDTLPAWIELELIPV